MAPVLITGASGLIGRWVSAQWPDEIELVAVRHAEHDLLDPERFVAVIEHFRPSAVLHLAWTASGSPGYRTSTDNLRWVRSSHAAASYCLEHDIAFFGTGSVADRSSATDLYSRSKQQLRRLLAVEIDAGLVGWLRPFYAFDPASGRPALVSDSLRALAERRPVELRTAAARHDFVHAFDVGSAVVTSIRNDLRGSLDIGSGALRSVAALVEACGATWISEEHPSVTHLEEEPVADRHRLEEVGWRAQATDEFFLERTDRQPS